MRAIHTLFIGLVCFGLSAGAMAQKPNERDDQSDMQEGETRQECTTQGIVTNCFTVGPGTFHEMYQEIQRLRAVPRSADADVIANFEQAGEDLAPPFYMEWARRVLERDPEQAAYFALLSRLRMVYDGNRCVDRSAGQGMIYILQMYADTVAAIPQDVKLSAITRLRDDGRVFAGTNSAWWICSHGIRRSTETISQEDVLQVQDSISQALDQMVTQLQSEEE